MVAKEDQEDVRREIQIMHHLSGHKNVVAIKGAERKAAELTRIIVGVVEACHSLGVMHRDLKPENFLLANEDDDSSLKAIDFGLSIFFKTETQQGIFDAVLKGVMDFDSDPWPMISDSAKVSHKEDALFPSLRTSYCSRPPDRALDPAVLSQTQAVLGNEEDEDRIRWLDLKEIAGLKEEEEIAGLKEMFHAMDTDNSGAITFDELKEVDELQQACKEHNLTDVLIDDIIGEVDQDNDGRIDFGEFVADSP
ncbi:hypothetical protein ZIOFF_003145 [Zingiber officinale]|uniref:Uncharacterized protein n=1 Tax=Zingiber officinale TaxID=94328 RepID=A0A8J5HXY0_ZINOF|nr:hypothetical protein ZIOFF_003145 [Zingiber officinale]